VIEGEFARYCVSDCPTCAEEWHAVFSDDKIVLNYYNLRYDDTLECRYNLREGLSNFEIVVDFVVIGVDYSDRDLPNVGESFVGILSMDPLHPQNLHLVIPALRIELQDLNSAKDLRKKMQMSRIQDWLEDQESIQDWVEDQEIYMKSETHQKQDLNETLDWINKNGYMDKNEKRERQRVENQLKQLLLEEMDKNEKRKRQRVENQLKQLLLEEMDEYDVRKQQCAKRLLREKICLSRSAQKSPLKSGMSAGYHVQKPRGGRRKLREVQNGSGNSKRDGRYWSLVALGSDLTDARVFGDWSIAQCTGT